jgi:hypothetical protein
MAGMFTLGHPCRGIDSSLILTSRANACVESPDSLHRYGKLASPATREAPTERSEVLSSPITTEDGTNVLVTSVRWFSHY